MQYRKMIIGGGASFVVGALAFVFVFSYLAANFNYYHGTKDDLRHDHLGNLKQRGVEAIEE